MSLCVFFKLDCLLLQYNIPVYTVMDVYRTNLFNTSALKKARMLFKIARLFRISAGIISINNSNDDKCQSFISNAGIPNRDYQGLLRLR